MLLPFELADRARESRLLRGAGRHRDRRGRGRRRAFLLRPWLGEAVQDGCDETIKVIEVLTKELVDATIVRVWRSERLLRLSSEDDG